VTCLIKFTLKKMNIKLFFILLLTIILSITLSCSGSKANVVQQNYPQTNAKVSEKIAYDSLLAKQLGADDYGMRSYVMALLKPGPNRTDFDAAELKELQKGHMENINRLAEEGKLILAGPFYGGKSSYSGIFIFNVKTIDEAEALVNSDPAIAAGSLDVELSLWYGSAALMIIPETHQKVALKNP